MRSRLVAGVLLISGSLISGVFVASPASASISCDPGWNWQVTQNRKNYLSPKYRTSVTNSTSHTITADFTTTEAGTYTWSVGASLSAEAKAAIFANVKLEINGSITKSKTTTYGVTTHSSVNPHSTLKADYGVMVEYVYGNWGYTYSNCDRGRQIYTTFRAPYRTNWHIYY